MVPEPWSDVGATTPKAALQSLLWALNNDNWDRAQQLMQWDMKGTPVGPFAFDGQKLILEAYVAPNIKDIVSFQILSITPAAKPNEVLVKFKKTFKNTNIWPFAMTAKLRHVGGQWRVVGDVEYFQNGNMSTLLPFLGSF